MKILLVRFFFLPGIHLTLSLSLVCKTVTRLRQASVRPVEAFFLKMFITFVPHGIFLSVIRI